jgi:predicted AAA+ superfamily ATPase
MKSIFDIIYNDPGQIININELSKELGFSRQLISTYLEYLEEAYLLKKLYNYSRNPSL